MLNGNWSPCRGKVLTDPRRIGDDEVKTRKENDGEAKDKEEEKEKNLDLRGETIKQ